MPNTTYMYHVCEVALMSIRLLLLLFRSHICTHISHFPPFSWGRANKSKILCGKDTLPFRWFSDLALLTSAFQCLKTGWRRQRFRDHRFGLLSTIPMLPSQRRPFTGGAAGSVRFSTRRSHLHHYQPTKRCFRLFMPVSLRLCLSSAESLPTSGPLLAFSMLWSGDVLVEFPLQENHYMLLDP